uniref:Uncharacterized protein n=1 Tax=Arcella intermedia TaxID=1963864 RepID=A0A6B2KZW3_9EUKA
MKIREKQIEALKKMLQLNLSPESEEYWQNLWKVLIYDDVCQDILSPLFSVEDLRRQGVTLHLSLHKTRQPVPDVPAIYFVSPTKENISRICEDCSKRLYSAFHINFSSSISRELLEELAYKTVQSNTEKSVVRVFDQYMNFVSLEDHLFVTRHKNSYFEFHNPLISDHDAIQNVEEIVDSLFSVAAALGQVPIIQCPRKGDAAEIIAKSLDEKIRNHLGNVANLFSESSSPGIYKSPSNSGTSFQRPVLIILDRNVDLTVMMSHAWSYKASVHDLLSMHNNTVVLNKKEGGTSKYSLDPTEPFWNENGSIPFYQVAVSVKQKVDELEAKIKDNNLVGNSEQDLMGSELEEVTRKLDLLPEINKQKEIMEMHGKIALSLLENVNTRGLDVLFRLEEGVMARSALQKKKDILAALEGNGKPMDKMRLFLIYYIMHQNISQAELSEFEEKLEALGCDLTPLIYLKQFKAFDDNWSTTTSASPVGNSPFGVGDLVGSFKTMFNAGIQLFVPTTKDYYVTRIVDAVMEMKQDKIVQDFLYFDPSQKTDGQNFGRTRTTSPFKEAIVFMVGGGNYLEFLNLKEYAKNSIPKDGLPTLGKTILYGSTELFTGEQFVDQLRKLGAINSKNPN